MKVVTRLGGIDWKQIDLTKAAVHSLCSKELTFFGQYIILYYSTETEWSGVD